ncbi:hypothetical protein Cpap_4030 [Ruminiclostridium papyrosolvens DSM 2782]|uniref:Uncharacterized protein n=1 Tax=Ruminiclostridium papyrosolvens DSM 2782 TaxID=588581 RepID=F1T7Z4_9FIRM|nr:hypothetical protein [Ruminiclostridium papyrosolvens]EGD49592.1 hypothetical protein Cpap_4030 [Ruminiclostridium papyrosolvens DSM 2782]WES33282.1 hypothetical protein P0092_16150 [Ruminiclostridium papyrosolvens DSM 2782]
MSEITEELKKCFITIQENNCWFINQKIKPYDINGLLIKTNENSLRGMLLKAIPKANIYEKIMLGLSYQKYSQASNSIHNGVNLNEVDKDWIENAVKIEMLIITLIINKCQILLDLYPHDANKEIPELVASFDKSNIWIAPLFKNVYEINDYVYTNDGSLGRIEEIITSKIGYNTLKVKYLVDKFPEYGEFGFYPAHLVMRIHSRKQLKEIMIKNANDTQKEVFNIFLTEEKLTRALDDLMTMWWSNGYKEKILYKDDSAFDKTIKNELSERDSLDLLLKQKLKEINSKVSENT